MNHLPSPRPWDRETEEEKAARASGWAKVAAQNALEALAVKAAEKEIARINRKEKSAMKEKSKNRPKAKMKLYLLTRIGSKAGRSEYNCAVVMATSPLKARRIHPDGQEDGAFRSVSYPTWVPFEQVRATYIGNVAEKVAGVGSVLPVVCASCNSD